jgi:hypothetical protein
MYKDEKNAISYNNKYNRVLLRAFFYLCGVMIVFSISSYCILVIWYLFFSEECAARYRCDMPSIGVLVDLYVFINPYVLAVPFVILIPYFTTIKRWHFIVLCAVFVIGVCWVLLWCLLVTEPLPEYYIP